MLKSVSDKTIPGELLWKLYSLKTSYMKERILIADDHYVVRAGTALVLETAFPGLEIDFAENYEQVKKS